jgi:hypothetical protein
VSLFRFSTKGAWNCNECGNKLGRTEPYIAVSLNLEVRDWQGEVTVLDSEPEEIYHKRCAPKRP